MAEVSACRECSPTDRQRWRKEGLTGLARNILFSPFRTSPSPLQFFLQVLVQAFEKFLNFFIGLFRPLLQFAAEGR